MIFDVVIIGSGVSGLTLALNLSRQGCRVGLLSKGALKEGNTRYAQGGIAAVMAKEDSFASHIEDTITVGAGLCLFEVVNFVISSAQEAVTWLIEQGINFTKRGEGSGANRYDLTREGGHSHRRILHVADATGAELEFKLVNLTQDESNIAIFSDHTAIDLIKDGDRCVGVYALDNRNHHVKIFQGKFIILATGGASKVYLYTSNPDCATGDGIAMAERAGCQILNMEFNQFHPTCLYHHKAKSFLISEAVRGEGGVLLLPDGRRFMSDFDSKAELAPRDIVARAIDHVMKRFGLEHVYLDISHKPKEFIVEHFPNIYQKCLQYGFDMAKEPIPVVPAAHYTCGGVSVDLRARTNILGLYAIGEVACTGFHGANRLASNSLLECIVFARAASRDILENLGSVDYPKEALLWDESQVTNSDEEIVLLHNWQELRRLMWNYVGIVRTDKRLERARHRINLLKKEIQEYYGNFHVTKDLLELRNMIVVADLIVKAASTRKENVGLHYNLDNITI